jgi:'Cold-shock' DNA-binding domain
LKSDAQPRDVAQPQTPTGVFRRRPEKAQGTVKLFNAHNGFGFIQPVDGGSCRPQGVAHPS